jgi:CRP-like cAMP-binding protein
VADNQNELLASLLASGAQSRLRPHIRTAHLPRGQILAEPLERITQVYFPYSGVVSFLVPLRDGRLVQTGVVGRDGGVGALQALEGQVSANRIVVQVPGRAAVVQIERLAEIVQDYPALRSLILRHEQFFLSEVQQSAACNALHTVQQRVCRWILRMNDLVGMSVAVTQELLAEMIGVRRTSVSAAAAFLQAEGIIKYRRGHIQIVDIERLKQSSCECYQTLRDYQHIVQPPGATGGTTDASR